MNSVHWLESFSEEEAAVKNLSDPDLDVTFREEPVQDLEPGELPEGAIVTIRTHSRFSAEQAERAGCVISRSTGYDHLLDQYERLSGRPIGHLSKYATDAVADHNLTVALALNRRLPRAQRSVESFRRNDLTGGDIASLSPGIVGVGDIGSATAKRLMDLGLTVRGHDLRERPRLSASNRFEYVPLERLFASCNLILLCLPHTEATEGLITRDLLGSLPDGSLLVNAGRGEVVRNRDLRDALRDGPLDGLGLDVFNAEEALREHLRERSLKTDAEDSEVQAALELLRDERVIGTPHNAFNSKNALREKVRGTLANIESYREDGELLNPVEPDDSTG